MPQPLTSASTDFHDIDLGDARRTRRLVRCVEELERQPAQGFPKVFDTDARLEAFYRLVNNPDVPFARVVGHHAAKAWERARVAGGCVLAIHDSSEYVVPGQADRKGLTRRGTRQMFTGHHAIVVPETGAPVVHGGVGFHPYIQRDGTWFRVGGNDGETSLDVGSDRWFDLFAEVEEAASGIDPIHVMDREGDAWNLLAKMDEREASFVVRSAHDRLTLAGGEKLSEILEGSPVVVERDVELSRRSRHRRAPSKTHGARRGRPAKLSIRYEEVELAPPRDRREDVDVALFVTVVDVVEENPPEGETPIHWRLLTNLPVHNAEGAARIVDIYRRRWLIEEYFKAIKTGCGFTKRQANTRASLLRTLSLLLPIAVTLLNIRTLADVDPKAPWRSVLDPIEFEVLKQAVPQHKLHARSNVRAVMLAIAKMGGHLKSNGAPGWQVLGRGLETLLARADGWRAAMAYMGESEA